VVTVTESLDGDHQTFMPPSTTISTPVTYELSFEARNRATFATSSERPRRPNSVLQILANPGQVLDDVDSKAAKRLRFPDA
jgi:hypothetical protein